MKDLLEDAAGSKSLKDFEEKREAARVEQGDEFLAEAWEIVFLMLRAKLEISQ
jgi:hypothetical protein